MVSSDTVPKAQESSSINRREAIVRALGPAAAIATMPGTPSAAASSVTEPGDARRASPRAYRMKKSINLWAFPFPGRMSLVECLKLAKDAGFDGIELNFDLDSELSPKSGPDQFRAIRKMADDTGIAISGLCSFLYWPFSLTDNDPARALVRSSLQA